MEKIKELTDPNSCINRALPGEIVFVLLARDPVAPTVVRAWAASRVATSKNERFDPQITEALNCADEMDAQRDIIRAMPKAISDPQAFEHEVDATVKVFTPELLDKIASNDMPECFEPTRVSYVAMARLLMTALGQNDRLLIGALASRAAGNS